jgi:molybdopterin molybdotransferase
MPEFLSLTSLQEALERLLDALPEGAQRVTETVETSEALGRVLASPIRASEPLPPFDRSTVDGYAVRAKDTFGASSSLPAYLKVLGEIKMGEAAIEEHEGMGAILIHTGGMIPQGANAVVMLENTQAIQHDEIEVHKPVAVGENILKEGEDVGPDDIVIPAGTRLRPAEIGGLMALGFTEVPVHQRIKVGIISTGDEVVPPDAEPGPGQVRDVNTYTLKALVETLGGESRIYGIVPDNYDALLDTVTGAHRDNDVVLITAGSSVSARDMSVDVIQALGAPGVLVHGIALKPGKPTILAVAEGVPTIGLPGNPVSALVVGGLILRPLFTHLMGLPEVQPTPIITAKLMANVASQTGREDYQPVRIIREDGLWMAEPVHGRSNLIFTLVRSGGMVRIPPESTGMEAGAFVEVMMFG